MHTHPGFGTSAFVSAVLRRAVFVFLIACSARSWAKDAPVLAVLLFDQSGQPAYVQVTGVLINGKTELRLCSGNGPIDKSAYKNATKITLATVRSLKRLPDGSLAADTGGGATQCVLPGNFKYEKDGAFTPADLVDKSVFAGQVLGSDPPGVTALPPFKPGSSLIFVPALDKQTAEYLRAANAGSIPILQAFVAAYPGGVHATEARHDLAQLLDADGAAKLALYRKSAGTATPAFAALQAAREDADAALAAESGDDAATTLRSQVQTELKGVVQRAANALSEYRNALAQHAPGYGKLVQAATLSAAVVTVDPKYVPGQALQTEAAGQTRAVNTAIESARSQMKAQQYETAAATLAPYSAFAVENAEVKQAIAEVYQHYMDEGAAASSAGKWKEAVEAYKRADAVTTTAETKAKLVEAETGLLSARNRAAADQALSKSQEYGTANDPIRAYEVLADLSDPQRALVAEQMAALEIPYAQAATARAKQLQQTHTPIKGRADEDAMRQAYEYYRRVSKLSEDEELKVKMELLAGEISGYYVGLGRKYMEKPLSSEVGLGWAYMAEALQYRNNLDVVWDEMTKNGAAYQMRARLSIGVVFRDQTSRRDSAGFADQMQQAFATGLETSGLPVKVILPGSAGTLEPNFQFIGEILQHRTIRNPKKTTLRSEYRSGSREVPNEQWNKADQEYEADVLELQRSQAALASAQTHNNKKQMEQAATTLSDAEKKTQEARARMNALPRTISEPIVSPYSYTKTALELTNIVELSFRILDSAGNTIQGPTKVVKGDQPKTFTLLDNIKPDDTQGLKEADTPPDETQLMTDVEIEARDTMVKAAREKVLELPSKVLAQARSMAASGDSDAAAELYVLYLNSTPAETSSERTEASRFLSENFNIRHGMTLSASLQ